LRKKRQALDRLLPTLRATSDPLTRDMYLGHASAAAGVTRELLERELATPSRARASRVGRSPAPAPASDAAEQRGRPAPPPDVARVRRGDRRRNGERTIGAERELVRVLLHRPTYFEQVVERVGAEELRDPELAEIFSALIDLGPEAPRLELAEALSEDAVEVLQELLEETGGLDNADKSVEGSLAVLQVRGLTRRMAEIDSLMPLATDEEKDALTQEKVQLRDELNSLGKGPWKQFR
jgi:hypothetical protein